MYFKATVSKTLKYYLILHSNMESISLKLEAKFAKDIEKTMKKHRYSTKTEFIREAIREKIDVLEKKEALKRLENIYGASKRKTTDEELHAAGEKAFREIEEELKYKTRV